MSDFENGPRFDEANMDWEDLRNDPAATPAQRAAAFEKMWSAHTALRDEMNENARQTLAGLVVREVPIMYRPTTRSITY